MPAIILPDKWRRQPLSGARIDLSHKLAQGLLFDLDPLALLDRKNAATITNNGTTRTICSNGAIGAAFNAASSTSLSLGDPSLFDFGSNDFGFEFAYTLSAQPSSGSQAMLVGKDQAGGRQIWIEIDNPAGTCQIRMVWINGSITQQAIPAGVGVTVGTRYHLIFQRRGNSSEAWVNGVKQATSNGVDHTGWAAVASTSTEAFLGRRAYSGFASYYTGSIDIARVRSGALSDSAAIELASNPYQIYAKSGRIYFLPAGGGGATITAATESLTLSTFAATVGSARDIAGALESLSLTPYAALVSRASAITAAVESISLGTYAATVANNATVAGGLESISLTANAASITLGAAIAAAMEAIVLAANPAAVALDAAIAAQLEAITITGLSATISTSSDVNIGAALESITLSVPQALVSSDRTIAGGLESIQITANGATVTLGALIGAALESIALTSYGAGITLNVTLPGGLEQINLTTLAAQIGLGSNVAALVEAITLTPFGATLTMTGEITAALESIGLTTFVASVTGGESALTTPGLEFTVPVGRMHYAIPIGRIHFTIPRD